MYWMPAISGMICLGLGAGLLGVFGFFVAPVSQEFGVSVAALNIAPVALLLAPGLLSPIIGRLVDALSIRRIVLCGVTLANLSLCVIALAPTARIAAAGFLCFSVGVSFYGPVVINGLIVKVYAGREARALALAAMGISVATAVLPPVVGELMQHMDWRTALLVLALGLLLILYGAAWFGLPADASKHTGVGRPAPVEGLFRNRSFWLIGLCVAVALNVLIVLAVVYPPLFISRGFSVAQAGWLVALTGIAGLAGKSAMALLADAARDVVKWLAATVLTVQALGMAVLWLADTTNAHIAALCLLGFGGGAFIPMYPYLNSRYFDAAVIGRVSGAQMPLFLPFGLAGAPLAGLVFDQTGRYDLALSGLLGALIVAVALVLCLPAPRR